MADRIQPTDDPHGPVFDLWADVPFDHLPPALVTAFDRRDWPAVKAELSSVMDAVATDGRYGRELLKLVLKLPIGLDPIFDRYRGAASVDFGDWDGLERCLRAGPSDPVELSGLRDIILAPLGRTELPPGIELHQRLLFQVYEYQFAQNCRAYRRWASEIRSFRPVHLWARGDMPITRHARYRQLQDAFFGSIAEVHGGRLSVALSYALEAQHLGDETEPIRTTSRDLLRLLGAATGDLVPDRVEHLDSISRPTGMSPVGSWQSAVYLLPLISASRMPALVRAAELASHIAAGLASPRAQLIAEGWKIAARLTVGSDRVIRELPGLLAQARHASVGLRVMPKLLEAVVSRRPDDFIEAEAVARRAGNVWAQVGAMVWLAALNPKDHDCHRLRQLLDVSGWRRPVLVPPEIAADAALGMVAVGAMGRSVIELAEIAGRPNVTIEVARRHIADAATSLDDKVRALDAVATVGSTHAHHLLRDVSKRQDDLGKKAGMLLARPSHPFGLSDREVEVLAMAGRGLTNREIASELALSAHTIARHLTNARVKLGAANRTEAATRVAMLPRP